MHLPDGFWTSITYVVSFFSPHPFYGSSSQEQAPFLGPLDGSHQVKLQGPIFKPPGGSLTGPDSNFTCDYSNMVGWTNCSTSEDRKCWLRNDETQEEFNITTDYETLVPIGIERYYELNVTDGLSVNADGLGFDAAKLFDGQYPGPWIQACWGDVRIRSLPSPAQEYSTMLTIRTDCHSQSQQSTCHRWRQWYQYPLARNSTMENHAHGWRQWPDSMPHRSRG